MRLAARRVVTIGHTYNLVDLPIVVAGKSGTAEFGLRDKQGRLPYHSWFVAFVPKKARKVADDPNGYAGRGTHGLGAGVLAFAYDSRTKGNAATEIVKYFLQIHYRGQEGPPQLRPAQARQLLPGQLSRGHAATGADPRPGLGGPIGRRDLDGVRRPAGHLRAAAGRHRPADGLHQLGLHAAHGRLHVHARAGLARRWPSSPS